MVGKVPHAKSGTLHRDACRHTKNILVQKLDTQVGGFLIEENNFTNYSLGFDINGGGRHTLRDNYFGPVQSPKKARFIALFPAFP